MVETDEIFISHVASLFTKTPIDTTLKIVQNRLKVDSTSHQQTNLTVNDMAQLPKPHIFNSKVQYTDKKGFAMGDPLSASGFFMEDLESKAIATAPKQCRLSL